MGCVKRSERGRGSPHNNPNSISTLKMKDIKNKRETNWSIFNEFLALSPRLVHFKVLVSNLNGFLGNICCRLHSTIRKDGASQGRGEQNAKNEWKLSSEFRYFFKIRVRARAANITARSQIISLQGCLSVVMSLRSRLELLKRKPLNDLHNSKSSQIHWFWIESEF